MTNINTKDPRGAQVVTESLYRSIFADADPQFVRQAFSWFAQSFAGRYHDYQAIDVGYHDVEHTMHGTLCLVRLLRGRYRSGAQPILDRRMFELGLLAILFHDSGYLKRGPDNNGTGAKYTVDHVERSIAFVEKLLLERGYEETDITAIQNMIRCTQANADIHLIRFQSETEKIVGMAVGSADLLGQMAASDYVAKLKDLYVELAESTLHIEKRSGVGGQYTSVEDLMRDTPDFWENYAKRKLENEFQSLYKYLSEPYPDGANTYLERIEANIVKLRKSM